MQEGVDGLLRDKTRPPDRKPLDPAVVEQVIALIRPTKRRIGPLS